MAAEEQAPEPRRILVDVALQLEVLVEYEPELEGDGVTVMDVTPDWAKLQVLLAYWQPTERQTVIGVRADIVNHLEANLPKRLELRYRHD